MGRYLFLVVKGKNFSKEGWPEFLFPAVNPKFILFQISFVWKIGSVLIWLVRITNVALVAAICRRLRTVPCYRTSAGSRISSQIA